MIRKVPLIIFLLTCIIPACFAQLYTVERYRKDYIPLDEPIQVSLEEPWGDTMLTVPIGFEFELYGQKFDTCYLDQGGIIFYEGDPYDYIDYDTFFIFFCFNHLFDLGHDSTSYSLSPVSYNLSGILGNQVLKIEYKNAWVVTGRDGTRYSIDLQLWLHEYNGTIEVHFGEYNADVLGYFYYFMGISMLYIDEYGEWHAVRQTRLAAGTVETEVYGGDDPWVTCGITPKEDDVWRFLYDRDIILNNHVDLTLISGITHIGTVALPTYASDQSILLGGHGYLNDYEWAERFILTDPVVLKGLVGQHYGRSSGKDSAYYSIYLPGMDLLPGESTFNRKISYEDFDLSGKLNIIGFEEPFLITDTFFVAFGVNPYFYEEGREDIIGVYFTPAQHSIPSNFDYGRTAVRRMDGNWYDIYSSRWISRNSHSKRGEHPSDLIHFSIAPIVNFFTKNTTPVDDILKAWGQYAVNVQDAASDRITLYPHYPNPAGEFINLRYEVHADAPVILQVFKLNGTMVMNKNIENIKDQPNTVRIDIKEWEPGEYIYIIKNGTGALSSSFVKL